jgi:hypothetical protein
VPSVGIEVVVEPRHGRLIVGADGAFSYRPDLDFVGVDTFRYRLVTGGVRSLTATVTLRVDGDAGGLLVRAPFDVPVREDAGHVTIEGLEVVNLSMDWMVPSVALSVPGLLLIVILLAQALGGALWLPWIGRFRRGMTWRPTP